MPFYLYLNILSELSAVILGTVFIKSLKKKYVFLYIFVCYALVTEVLLHLLSRLGVKNTLPGTHIYGPIEFLLLAFLYYFHFNKSKIAKWIIVSMVLFELYCIINLLFIQGFYEYSNTRAISSLILVLFSILYFNKVMIETNISKLSAEPMVWINTAVLLYFSANLFYNILFMMILDYSREFSKLVNIYFTVFNVGFYILIAIGFWKTGKQHKHSTTFVN
ncbi:hypothetical protein OU798_05250 [Prolixibacteraceae bacterium Z1-6]|uniref:Uncharacterized protein n=1 Tax=Draconibacterium aestuarii TaxID=2998507 RepID=A0A9X3F4P3_9BACT|nr:hypothetical protein [Prolixibacteraceae bacterium Z1-6]